MRHTQLPSDAFEHFFALGASRSFAAVAAKYGVSRKTVAHRAMVEDWEHRVVERERKVREATDKSVLESLEAMTERHLRMARAIQARGIEALRSMPIRSARDAIWAIDVGVRQERELRVSPKELEEREEGLEEMRRLFREELASGVLDGAVNFNLDSEEEEAAPPAP